VSLPGGDPFLELEGVCFGFPNAPRTLQDIRLTLAPGEVHGILGRSGCGKTTLLKLAAGLFAPQAGRVTVRGRAGHAARADIGFMFQQPTLLEWLPVLDNVLLPVTLQRQPAPGERERALQLLAQLGLVGLEGRRPGQLSGGQQSRVALARALVLQPSLLLLDEPFAALDALTREALQQDLLALCASQGTTTLFVTHDISEAVFLADRVSVMHAGRIVHENTIDLPRPRDAALRGRPEFAALGAQIREALA
jgi:NitT/TauT family transport system ATP-binding protein